MTQTMKFESFDGKLEMTLCSMRTNIQQLFVSTTFDRGHDGSDNVNLLCDKLFHGLHHILSEFRSRQNETLPIHRLPNEIICQIVDLASSGRSDYIRLSHVDRRWRGTIIGNPLYWNSINLSWNVERIKTAYQRSGRANLQLDVTRQEYKPSNEAIIYSLLESDCTRIEKLDINISALAAERLPIGTMSFPSLKYLKISESINRFRNNHKLSAFVTDIDNLTALDLTLCFDMHWEPLQSLLHRVRQLSVSLYTTKRYEDFLSVLPTLPCLRHLSIKWGAYLPESFESEPTVNPMIESLHVIMDAPTTQLWKDLQFPNLRKIKIDFTSRLLDTHMMDTAWLLIPGFDYASIKYLHLAHYDKCVCMHGSSDHYIPATCHRSSKMGHSSTVPFAKYNITSSHYCICFSYSTFPTEISRDFIRKLSNLYELSHNNWEAVDSTALARGAVPNSIRRLNIVWSGQDDRPETLAQTLTSMTNANVYPHLEHLKLEFRSGDEYTTIQAAIIDLLRSKQDTLKSLHIGTDVPFESRAEELCSGFPGIEITHALIRF